MLAMPILITVMSMGYVAQSVALAFLMLAYVQFIKEGVIFFIICILIGAMFHPSVIVFLPMILLSFFNTKKLSIFILAGILGIIFYVFFDTILNKMIENYIDDKLESKGYLYRSLFNFISIFVFFIFINKKKLEKNYKILFYFFSISSSLLLLLYFAGLTSTGVDRMALYLIPIQILIINKFLNNYSVNSRKIVSFIFFIIYFTYMLVWFNFSNFSSYWMPYKNILF
jgi:hypothetical protein